MSGLSGTASLEVTSGTTTLSGTNIYTGATLVTSGTLIGTANAFSADSETTVAADGTLDLGGFAQNIAKVNLAGGYLQYGTLTGAITSTGGIMIDIGGIASFTLNSGDAMLRGANTFTGDTTLNGGTLRVGNDYTLSQGSLTTVNSGAVLDLGATLQAVDKLVLAGGTLKNGALAGDIFSEGGIIANMSGAASLTTTAGLTTLSGSIDYTGATNVNGGRLAVNTTLLTSALTVNTGGEIGGNGTVGNLTINGGTLAPGNSIGTLTVQGSLTLDAASHYMVEVSPTNADRVNVTDIAKLGNATVNAHFAPGSYIAKTYTILNAAGGIDGKFGAQVNTDLPSSFNSTLGYDGNNVYLYLALNYDPPTFGGGLSGNQRHVANALVGYYDATGGIPLAFGALTPMGLTQVSGETATGAQQTTFDAMSQFMGVMTDPFTAGRNMAGQGAAAFAEDDAMAYAPRGRDIRDALAMATKAAPVVPAFEGYWNVWAAGVGGTRSTDGHALTGSNTTTSRIAGSVVGADYRIAPNTIAGLSMAGGGTSFSVANGGSGSTDLFQAGAFLRHHVGSAYVTAAAAYGWQNISTDRIMTAAGSDRLHAQFTAHAYSGRVELGNRLVMPWIGGFGLTPFAAAQVTALDLPAYAEQAAGASLFTLDYAAKTAISTRTELGLRGDKSFAMQDAILTLRGRAAWAHDFNRDRSVAAAFQSLPGASFVVNGAQQAANTALTSASAEIAFSNGISLSATFDGEFSDVTQSYAGKGVVRYAW
ncbi:autotransporter domain-containing protein [Tardiphaga alba]|uniref:Autotransporter domain-containing protein n=1 Tax=Tardiphaga alba TaxID=340268 RepID=A0ABX8A8D6_9BRAD|nr:autotransporter domain-containing protein [Tardiphaga alba]QUS39266.1 autotransporter domain-containing protein [Tardiphaga alba]